MESNTFKSSLFGGFDREDVIQYITRTSAESTARIESLEADIARLTEQEDKLRIQRDCAEDSNRRLTERLEQAETSLADTRKSLESANSELEILRAELETLRAENAALRAEKDSLYAEVEKLRPLAEQYAAVKAHIAGIELDAHRRAEDYERGVRERLIAVIDECRAQCDTVLSTLGDTCANVTGELRRAEVSISALPAAFNTLRGGLEKLEENK